MNVAVLNLKDMLKYAIKIFATLILLFLISNYISKKEKSLSNILSKININNTFLQTCLNITVPELNNNKEEHSIKVTDLMRIETAILTTNEVKEKVVDLRF